MKLFEICPIHQEEPCSGSSLESAGTNDTDEITYLAKKLLFPFSKSAYGCDEAISFCSRCREAEKLWYCLAPEDRIKTLLDLLSPNTRQADLKLLSEETHEYLKLRSPGSDYLSHGEFRRFAQMQFLDDKGWFFHKDTVWEIWYDDLFDREAPDSLEVSGEQIDKGLAELWQRFLFEGLTDDGRRSFSDFRLSWKNGDVSGRVLFNLWNVDETVLQKVKSWWKEDKELAVDKLSKRHQRVIEVSALEYSDYQTSTTTLNELKNVAHLSEL